MSGPSTPVLISSNSEIVPESPHVTPPRSPRFISVDLTDDIKFSEEIDPTEDNHEPLKEKVKPPEDKSQSTAAIPTPVETRNEVTAWHLRLEHGEQRIAELERQVATMKNGMRKWKENLGRNSGQQQGKRQKTVETYVQKTYQGKLPHCNQCNRHHQGSCGPACEKCHKYGHQAKDCRSKIPKANAGAPKVCYQCGDIRHFKKRCPQLRNQNIKKNKKTRPVSQICRFPKMKLYVVAYCNFQVEI